MDAQRTAVADGPAARPVAGRGMSRTTLLGKHTHETASRKRVHIWKRRDTFLARGRVSGRAFGKTLGDTENQAEGQLCRLLVELEDGAFVRPSETSKRQLRSGSPPRLVLRQLCDEFLGEKRRLLGVSSTADYRSRLLPLIEFAETAESLQRWRLAMDIDRTFAIDFRSSLQTRVTTRNGRPAATPKRISQRQIWNILDTSRSLFHWARNPQVNLLATTFENPFTVEIVGEKPGKDPVRAHPLALDARVALVRVMDVWQLIHFTIPFLMGVRPDEYTRILISDIEFAEQRIRFGDRFGGKDFNKGKQHFAVPFPAEVASLLEALVADREDGPLLRRRTIFAGRARPVISAARTAEIDEALDRAVAAAGPDQLQAPQDVKKLIARVFLQMGAVSPDTMGKEFKALVARAGLVGAPKLYDLRGAVTTDLKGAGVDYLVQRYVTGHSTRDVMHSYSAIDLSRDMLAYFNYIRPLLDAMLDRAIELGIPIK